MAKPESSRSRSRSFALNFVLLAIDGWWSFAVHLWSWVSSEQSNWKLRKRVPIPFNDIYSEVGNSNKRWKTGSGQVCM